jgi:HlyD family secretion protein
VPVPSRTPLPRRARLGPALASLGAASIFGLACSGSEPPKLTIAEVELDRIERIVVATGTVEPVKEVEIRPRIAGIVERILVKNGDAVSEGQIVIEIERDLLASRVNEAKAALVQARVELRYAKIELRRVENLRKQGAASEGNLDDSRARAEQGAAGVARAAAQLETLRTQLGYASVVSPLAGRVLEVHTEEGSAVSPVTSVNGGSLLLSLAATDTLHLEGLVDENEVARVEVGQPARIRAEAFEGRIFLGEVREIAPMGKRVQNVTYFEVEIEITDPDASLLRPRMSGDAEIITEVVEQALVVPETALHYRGDQVYLELPGEAETPTQRDITIGIVDGAKVEVLEGIEAGERVILQ